MTAASLADIGGLPSSTADDGAAVTLADLDSICRRSVRAAVSQLEELEATRKRAIEEVEVEFNMLSEGPKRTIAEFEAMAEGFMRRRLEGLQKGDKKSVDGLYFSVTSTTPPPDIQRDDDLLEPWARGMGYIRDIPAVPAGEVIDWKSVRKDVLAGMKVPGTLVIPKDPQITVKLRVNA